MKSSFPDFSSSRTLVIGDLMLDRYWSGGAERVSPEAPVPVVHISEIEERPGGAGNVALNIAALGGEVVLLGVAGADEEGKTLERVLSEKDVECDFQQESSIKTSTKLRVMSRHQQLIRLDFEDSMEKLSLDSLQEKFITAMQNCGAVILSDYGKGTLRDVQEFIQLARTHNHAVLIDPKGSDFTKYRGATLMTPNLSEFEAVVGRCKNSEEIVARGEELRQELELEALLVTRGEDGMTLICDPKENPETPYHYPTHAREVFDVTGAGDTVIATLAAGIAAGATKQSAVAAANLAAGIVVGKLGTATTSVAELHQAAHDPEESGFGVLDEEGLAEAIESAHQRGERVVMTNGCFDLLHTGHISYLAEARKLGDRLIVAVNSDESVYQLKGDADGVSRPINKLEQRMSMLSALESVDWVVPFSEETPERLYCRVLPDMIVKGGDYKPEEVAGGECVIANGGAVEILQFVAGHSTTNIIKKITKNMIRKSGDTI
ncbi:MAG: bifunctional D-glycero-beta-D-manno-heptose-7-phosphate kinase/D-glycero-beta-D-manno-heptose 1-phosphate adenylyltransferase HldE [Thiotrichales bacterium]|jgi:D-beta-D-heptose 7-phosphate kinase/D-beta-D-heptose 1-phosphate adenosyltransferase|nr:bifunctional D-glycero-beta-D-manno-heptose-7-phosphate kinase/D-glycero-beta-D-manno-heptose 1-phosphate adenylyltransferase HldE [Thiotrichales bacterium]MBT6172700.1 bifunctional D-glycero-beta-D-manno-heptose-7-phosphate kinase/D-glycero-beta-D-manno-heptose 1-phosphate adenylyltransferase HldE [Thiotrichales bacterium]MBT7006806.1 bifunctional D-glycero-beta-D-manno-heptose-7-phosphate kinase/D-glycero-beta-D-manno-heptose 1-phosphate adenylyltransferase HldE [Thiotrichales bacterium]